MGFYKSQDNSFLHKMQADEDRWIRAEKRK